MKYDTMQIERMESGGHRIEVRNEKESDVHYADGGPEALDIVKRVLEGAEVLQNFTEYPAPPATVPHHVDLENRIEFLEGNENKYIAANNMLADRIGELEEVFKNRITNLSTLDLANRIGELETRLDATQIQYERDFGRLRDAFTNATETMREPKGGDA